MFLTETYLNLIIVPWSWYLLLFLLQQGVKRFVFFYIAFEGVIGCESIITDHNQVPMFALFDLSVDAVL